MALLFIGAISGTSVDGLDLAMIDVEPDIPRIVDATTQSIPDSLADALRALALPGTGDLDRMASADAELGELIGHSVREFAASSPVRAVGSHGQTIRHNPRGAAAHTVQIGDPHRVAEFSGLDTIADFRRRDIAAGGEGAPLVPLFHEALFRPSSGERVVVNIGGISNLTILAPDLTNGFDTGPGNALLDAWIRSHRQLAFDRDGAWSATGRVIPKLLTDLEQDDFVRAPPPKSTGKDLYNLHYLRRRLKGSEDPADVQATLAEFTAASIATAVETWSPPAADVVVCGGGRLNGDLMNRLERRLATRPVMTTEVLGVDGDAVEAAAFAWLAYRFLERLPGNSPAVTGAAGPRVLGALYPANRRIR
ncbi:MAG: anhydro-N-acetylmuramic acid kinase [Gammaproteobacteria bacterium]|nr:anhydro-N-acetylmuramic acid kinase [Gammaproteobacteria bacterium]